MSLPNTTDIFLLWIYLIIPWIQGHISVHNILQVVLNFELFEKVSWFFLNPSREFHLMFPSSETGAANDKALLFFELLKFYKIL